ncbi:MAG TPA: CopD family protein [Candidatus Binataceae bacterium]|nr:CopD family protein [Candidatus Binataceae bacterium]
MAPFYGRAVLEWPLAFASLTIFGTAMFLLAARGFSEMELQSMVAAMLPAWRAMALAIVIISPLLLVSITSEMAAVSWPAAVPLVPQVMAQTHSGEVWRWSLPAGLLLLAVTIVPMTETARTFLLAGLGGTLMLLEAMLSHAADRGVIAVLVYLVHEAAAATWIGALLGFWMIARRAHASPAWTSRAVRLVSTTAAWSVAAIVVSGCYTAYQGVGLSIDRLLFSSYGRTLLVKVAAFCAVLSIGAYNRERLLPDVTDANAQRLLLRNVGIESLLLGTLVLGLASLLANTSPARGHMMSHPGMEMSLRRVNGPVGQPIESSSRRIVRAADERLTRTAGE